MKAWLVGLVLCAGCASGPVVRSGQELSVPVAAEARELTLAGEGEAACYEWVDVTAGNLRVTVRDETERARSVERVVACPGGEPSSPPRWVVLSEPPATLRVEYATATPPAVEVTVTFRVSRAGVQLVPSGQWIEGAGKLVAFAPIQTDSATVVLTDEKERQALSARATKNEPLVVVLAPGRYRLTSDRSEGLRAYFVQR